ncbi:MAG: transposase, partial [Hyphomicrobiaceae bacterium]
MATRDELIEAVRDRYRGGDRQDKSRILDEMCAVTGLHRKHMMRLLRASGALRRHRPRPERQRYDQSVVEALVVLWEASDRLCGKRLTPLVPLLIE